MSSSRTGPACHIFLERRGAGQYLVSFDAPEARHDDEGLALLSGAPWWSRYHMPVAVDASRAFSLLAGTPGRDQETLARVLNQSRLRFPGTDGMRGLVRTDRTGSMEALALYATRGIIGPDFIALATRAFLKLAIQQLQPHEERTLVLGNDGRDQASGWSLRSAATGATSAAGFYLTDLGTLPTPYVPWHTMHKGLACGAMITASHNPSSQNGIKFFWRGKKLLPEGSMGDYALSSTMLALALEDSLANAEGGKNAVADTTTRYPPLMDGSSNSLEALALDSLAELPGDARVVLGTEQFILDSANGSFFNLAPVILNKLGLAWTSVNHSSTGRNINERCGVAEIEGRRWFQSPDSGPDVVGALFVTGRARRSRAYGLVLDGDGDRGFVLCYLPEKDGVCVLDGDCLGYILARELLNQGKKGDTVLLTVESDSMAACGLEAELGLKVGTLSVGDKWIGHADQGSTLLGFEPSGHIIVPLEGVDQKGAPFRLLSGNGLLAALWGAYAVIKAGLRDEQLVEPFKRGFTKTFYCYFVDKTCFYRGSPLWEADVQAIDTYKLSPDLYLEIEPKEDPDILYAALVERLPGSAPRKAGAVFVRNSGTEDKNAVYVQTRPGLENTLLPLARSLWVSHLKAMKDESRPENHVAGLLIRILEQQGALEENLSRVAVEDVYGQTLDDGLWQATLHGLRKEGRLACAGSKLILP